MSEKSNHQKALTITVKIIHWRTSQDIEESVDYWRASSVKHRDIGHDTDEAVLVYAAARLALDGEESGFAAFSYGYKDLYDRLMTKIVY